MVSTFGGFLQISDPSINSDAMGPSPTTMMSLPTDSTNTTAGEGCSKGGPQGYRQGRGWGGNRQGHGARGRTNPSFKGHTTELGGHMFQVFHENNNRNQFVQTIEVLGKYFTKNMKYVGEIMPLARDLKNSEVLEPASIASTETDCNIVFKWEKKMTDYITCKNVMQSDLKAAYTIMWGQCSEALRAKVKSSNEYAAKSMDCNCEWLIKTIRGMMLQFDGQWEIHCSITNVHGVYHAYWLLQDKLLAIYLEEFTALVDTIEHYGGCIGYDTALIDYKMAAMTLDAKRKGAHDKLLAMDFLKKALQNQFGGLLTDLNNLYSRGADQYPKDLIEAHALLVNYQPPRTYVVKQPLDKPDSLARDGSKLTFTQLATPVPGTDRNMHPNIQCFACKNKGHYSNMCPKDEDVKLFQLTEDDIGTDGHEPNFTFMSIGAREMTIPKTWVLLDSQSTVLVFCNAKLLTNIWPCTMLLVVLTNGGCQLDLGTVWYNSQSHANILSLAECGAGIS